jgi:hypothetical protein
VAAFAAAAAVVLAGVIVLNSSINGHLTGFAREGGVTFYLGECHIRHLRVQGPTGSYGIGPPPYVQMGGGSVTAFTGHDIWDEGFFYGKGLDCIRRQGAHYPVHALRMLADATATSTPWPQADERTLGRVADVAPGVANDVLELDSGVALPMVEECVRAVDLDGGRIVVASGYADE